MNDKYIMDEIQKHMDQFRDCYEKSLLREDELSIKATFFVNIRKTVVKKAKINLTGRGSMSIKKQLSRCLLKEINQISFLKNKQDMPVRFSLLFDL